MSPEYKGPLAERSLVIHIAEILTRLHFPRTDAGYANALAILKQQHERVMPPVQDKLELLGIVSNNQSIIKITEAMCAHALTDGDYAACLMPANHLYAYGRIAFEHMSGGPAFNYALSAHRNLYRKVREDFALSDPYLRGYGEDIQSDIALVQGENKLLEELDMTRVVIHMVVLNGSMGEPARDYFDPYALLYAEE